MKFVCLFRFVKRGDTRKGGHSTQRNIESSVPGLGIDQYGVQGHFECIGHILCIKKIKQSQICFQFQTLHICVCIQIQYINIRKVSTITRTALRALKFCKRSMPLHMLHSKRAKRALACAPWQASEASPCMRATAGPPQELEFGPRSAPKFQYSKFSNFSKQRKLDIILKGYLH